MKSIIVTKHLPGQHDQSSHNPNAPETKGGYGSGNFGHYGRPGEVGGSGPATAVAERLPEVDEVDDLESFSLDGESQDVTYAYFITPYDQLIDVAMAEGEHADVVNQHPESFGLKPSDVSSKRRYQAMETAKRNGYIRVRYWSWGGGALAIESNKLDTATLRHLQSLYDNNKLFQSFTVSWEGEGGSISVEWPEFIDAKRVAMIDGKPELKQDPAIVVVKHLPGQHDQQSHDPTKGAAHSLDYDAAFDYAQEHNIPLDDFAGDWLKDHFDIPYAMNGWGQYNDKYTKIRDSYVVNDERTLKNNRALRNGEAPTNWAYKIDSLCESKFKTDSQVYRSASLSKDMVDKIIQTKSFVDLGFMSVSGGKRLPESYLSFRMSANKDRLPVMFDLKVPAGSSVGLMDTGEFVFPRGTKISVTSWRVNNGRYEIVGEVATP